MATADPETVELAEVARLFARLLLFELDADSAAALREPATAAALAELGVHVPQAADTATLDGLAAEFFETFLQPKSGGPPVQSLWTAGQYESDAAVEVRRLAAAAGLDLNRAAVRGAAPDHLGCLLMLWAETAERLPEFAAAIPERHLDWARPCLTQAGARPGFYGELALAVLALIEQLGPE